MNIKRKAILFLLSLFVIIGGILFHDRRDVSSSHAPRNFTPQEPVPTFSVANKAETAFSDPSTGSSIEEAAKVLIKMGATWNGEELYDKQVAFAKNLLQRLGCSSDWEHLIQVLRRDGLVDGPFLKWMAKDGPKEYMSMLPKLDMRKLVAGVGDPELKYRWSFYAGCNSTKEDLFHLLETATDKHAKNGLLQGYANVLMRSNPVGATREILLLRFEGMDPNLLPQAFREAPRGTNFREILSMLLQDNVGSRSSAKEVALQEWAESSPLEAADFILKHPEQCDPGSIGRVLHEWATPARQDEVFNWVLKLPQGKLRDISLNIVAQKFARRSPQRAWELALEISSQEKSFKENALQYVYDQWHEQNASAANAALERLR